MKYWRISPRSQQLSRVCSSQNRLEPLFVLIKRLHDDIELDDSEEAQIWYLLFLSRLPLQLNVFKLLFDQFESIQLESPSNSDDWSQIVDLDKICAYQINYTENVRTSGSKNNTKMMNSNSTAKNFAM
jgi:hypothetical protein